MRASCRCVRLVVAGCLLLSVGLPRLFAGENYALLVAVGEYDPKQLNKLPYTRNDVIEFRDVLLASGFKPDNIILMHDDPKESVPARLFPESAKIRRQLTLILSGRDDDDTVILGFAGHGVQYKGDDATYFCPLDVELEKKETLISFKELYDAMKACGAKKKLLLVDACRNDPRSVVARSRATVDLESVTRPQKAPVPESVLAYFSCASGQQSFEWPELKHGVFFYHVLDVWKNGAGTGKELTLDDLVYHSRKKTEAFVRNTLEATQTPELHGKSAGRWVLRTYDDKVVTNSLGMKLVRVPAGEYLRGAPDSHKDAGSDEKPQHRVQITKDFLLGMHEVTRGQFRQFVEADGYRTEAEKDGKGAFGFDLAKASFEQKPEYTWKNPGFAQTDEHPVVNVTWNDATAFCAWLSRKEGKAYRLPTEAEWEYACRAGSVTRYPGGDDPETLATVGNIADGTAREKYPGWTSTINAKDGYLTTAPVGKLQPNKFGLFDMHGNVCEWCADEYSFSAYAQFAGQTAVDPQGPPPSRIFSLRVDRGGSWFNQARYARSTTRRGFTSDTRYADRGFRVAAAP